MMSNLMRGEAQQAVPTPAPQLASEPRQQYNNERLFVLSHPSMNLIEITVAKELNKQYPKVFALLMFVPGKPDNTKQSGRTYVMDKKEFIKFSVAELFQLAFALEEATVAGTSDFIKFADSSKFNGGEQQIKKITVSATNNGGKLKVYINYTNKKTGANIATTFTKWDAIGFASQIRTLAEQATIIEAKMKVANVSNG